MFILFGRDTNSQISDTVGLLNKYTFIKKKMFGF